MASNFFENLNPVKLILSRILDNKYVNSKGVSTANLTNVHLKDLSLNTFHINKDLLSFSPLRIDRAIIGEFKIKLQAMTVIKISLSNLDFAFFCNEDLPPNSFMEDFAQQMVYLSAEVTKNSVKNSKSFNGTFLNILSKLSILIEIKNVKVKLRLSRPVFDAEGLGCPLHSSKCVPHFLNFEIDSMRWLYNKGRQRKHSEFEVIDPHGKSVTTKLEKEISFKIQIKGLKCFRLVTSPLIKLKGRTKKLPVLLIDDDIQGRFILSYNKDSISTSLKFGVKNLVLLVDSHNVGYLLALAMKMIEFENASTGFKNLNSFKEEQEVMSQNHSIIYQFNQSLLDKSDLLDRSFLQDEKLDFFISKVDDNLMQHSKSGFKKTGTIDILDNLVPASNISSSMKDPLSGDTPKHSQIDIHQLEQKCKNLLKNDVDESSLSIDTAILREDIYKSNVSSKIFTKNFSNKQTLNRSDISEIPKRGYFSKKKGSGIKNTHKAKIELESFYFVFVSDGVTSDLNDLLSIQKSENFLRVGSLNNIQLGLFGVSLSTNTEMMRYLDGQELVKHGHQFNIMSADSRVFYDKLHGDDQKSVHNFSASFSMNMNSFDVDNGFPIFSVGDIETESTSQGVDVLTDLDSETTNAPSENKAKKGKVDQKKQDFISLKISKGYFEDEPKMQCDVNESIRVNINSVLLVVDLVKEALITESKYFDHSSKEKGIIRRGSINLLKQEKSTYFEIFSKTDIASVHEWITKFLTDFPSSKETFIDLLQNFTNLNIKKIMLELISKESKFSLTLDGLRMGTGEESRQKKEDQNFMDRDISDIIQINNTEMRGNSLITKAPFKVEVARAYVEFFRHQANLRPDVRCVVSKVDLCMMEKLFEGEVFINAKLNVASVQVEALMDSLFCLIECSVGSWEDFEKQFVHAGRDFENLKKFFMQKYTKLYLSRDLMLVHEKMQKVVNLVFSLSELKNKLVYNVGNFEIKISTNPVNAKTSAQKVQKKKQKYISDMTFLIDQKNMKGRTDAKPSDSSFTFSLNAHDLSGKNCQLTNEKQINLAKLIFSIKEQENLTLLDSLLYFSVNNISVDFSEMANKSVRVRITNSEVFVDLFESRISKFVDTLGKLIKEINLNCPIIRQNIKSILDTPSTDQTPQKKPETLELNDIILEPFNFRLVLNDYSFSYQLDIRETSLASGCLSTKQIMLSRISFLDSSALKIKSLWQLKDPSPSKQLLAIDCITFKPQKHLLTIDKIAIYLPLHVINELDCYSSKSDFFLGKIEKLVNYLEVLMSDRQSAFDLKSVYDEMELGSVETEYQSIYKSYGDGEVGKDVQEIKQKVRPEEEGFELVVPSFNQVFRHFEEYVGNADIHKKNGDSGIDVKNLKNFLSKQSDNLRASLRVYVNAIRLKIQMPVEYFSLSLQDCFLAQMESSLPRFESTQHIIQISSFSLKNASQDIPLFTSCPQRVFFNLLLSNLPNSESLQFALHMSPLNFYLQYIRKVFPQIYEFFTILQKSSNNQANPVMPTKGAISNIKSGLFRSVNYIRGKLGSSIQTHTEESVVEESLNDMLTQSLSNGADFELISYDFEEESETHVSDFYVAPLSFKFFKKSSSLDCIEIVTRAISPESDIKFDQSMSALMKLILSSIRSDLWKNKHKLWNLRSLNFVLLLANIVTVIVSRSQPSRNLKSFSRKSLKKIRKKAINFFKGE